MSNCTPVTTLFDTSAKLLSAVGPPVADPSLYRSLVGALQYLTFTRPDIAYAVQKTCLYMHDPCEPHFTAMKRILRYLKGTISDGLHITHSNKTTLTAYTDADWAGCPNTRHSTSGFAVFLGNNLISWPSKRQPTVSRSSAEAEYHSVANLVAKTIWIRNLILELHCLLNTATLVYWDNICAVRVFHVPSSHKYADIFTKCLPTSLFQDFKSSLNVHPHYVSTARGY
ncbi:PREDICTED: uncharacterized protein LOC109127985 [Camelina sativa]|uniref:Uncharacterized protein LOC109127985 n=1 Tax=Camelina sativa TaxID=90675 RepID=A0ABM1QQZ2_CAMSA|nr:PREDICTED: uncharacterized protein LOC109127985 [Camelina sativa]